LNVATWIALGAVILGLAAWWRRDQLSNLSRRLQGVGYAAGQGFGFEQVNVFFARLTQGAAAGLQQTQTGQLNWNALGIVAGLLLVVLVVIAGGG
jgi:hypothetical protein